MLNTINLSLVHLCIIDNLNININTDMRQSIEKPNLKLQRKIDDAIDLLRTSPDLTPRNTNPSDVHNKFHCYAQINKRMFFIVSYNESVLCQRPDQHYLVDLKSKRLFQIDRNNSVEMKRN